MLARDRIALRLRSSLMKSESSRRSFYADAATTRFRPRLLPASSPQSIVSLETKRTLANPVTTGEVPSPAWNIARDLQRLRNDKWGFMIYRTNYDDDQSWRRFRAIITNNASRQIEHSDAPHIAPSLTWTLFDSRDAFQHASKADLRAHLNRWVQDNWHLEQPHGKYFDPETPRYRYFVEVDRGVLDSMREVLDEEALMDVSYVNPVDAKWRPLSERSPDKLCEKFEAIGGVTEEDVGWMRLHAYLIGPQGYDLFSGHDIWYNLYVRPPEIVLY